jgi:hypothetical protein
MRLAIMQPYFLPYIGYFQLIRAADLFVYYDDVTFIKQSWINRNRILLNDKDYLFTLELKGAGSFTNINRIAVGNNRPKLLKTFIQAYRKAPFFEMVLPVINTIFTSSQPDLTEYIIETHRVIFDYLDVKANCVRSSMIEKSSLKKGQEKVIDICRSLGAEEYINSPGGRMLYSKEDFAGNGINLSFLQPGETRYPQFGREFIPWLSIIDILMFNSAAQTRMLLDNYALT